MGNITQLCSKFRINGLFNSIQKNKLIILHAGLETPYVLKGYVEIF